jgi:hypothetical protein
MKNIFYLFFAASLVSFSCASNNNDDTQQDTPPKNETIQNPKTTISLPLGGNAYSSKHLDGNNTITDNGIENWTDSNEFFTAYFKISNPGTFQITVEESVEVNGKSEVEFSINNESKKVNFTTTKKAVIAGTWTIKQAGYVAVKIKGISKTGDRFPSISRLTIASADYDGKIAYVPNNEGDFYHWGRRGPSVHLNYQVQESINA